MSLFEYQKSPLEIEMFKSMDIETLEKAGVDVQELEKAMNKQGYVQKEITVTRNGKTFTRKQWVKAEPDDDDPVKMRQQREKKLEEGRNWVKTQMEKTYEKGLEKIKQGASAHFYTKKTADKFIAWAKERGYDLEHVGDMNGVFNVAEKEKK